MKPAPAGSLHWMSNLSAKESNKKIRVFNMSSPDRKPFHWRTVPSMLLYVITRWSTLTITRKHWRKLGAYCDRKDGCGLPFRMAMGLTTGYIDSFLLVADT